MAAKNKYHICVGTTYGSTHSYFGATKEEIISQLREIELDTIRFIYNGNDPYGWLQRAKYVHKKQDMYNFVKSL